MLAMMLRAPKTRLEPADVPVPEPGRNQILVRVDACAVCRTDLHVIDGDLRQPKLPLIPGHEIVGTVVDATGAMGAFANGDRVGIPWLGRTCGDCSYCMSDRENLCDRPLFTGYQIDGGYAEYAVADWRYCFKLPGGLEPAAASPLMCAGLIGYRSLLMAADAERLGIYGFGAAAHIVAQVARYEGRRVFAFTRPGDEPAQQFAREHGAEWAGDSTARCPEELDAAIIFAPVGALVPLALHSVAKGGIVICGGIHMSDIPAFPYELLWGERTIRSVANLTRRDAEEFLALVPRVPIHTEVSTFPLAEANTALDRLRAGDLRGAAVLLPPGVVRKT